MSNFSLLMPYYIKKDDAKRVVLGQKRMMTIILVVMAIVVAMMVYTVIPKITGIYKDMGLSMPETTKSMMTVAPYFCVGLGALAIYFSSNNFLDEDFEKKIVNYKDGEMVNSMDFLSYKVERMMMVVIGLVVGYLILSVIMPIYNLTNTI